MKSIHKFISESLALRNKNNSLRMLKAESNLLDFCSNDYLGFARSSDLRILFEEELKKHPNYNMGSGGSRLLAGNSTFAEELEQEIAKFHQSEAALLFNSGYDANVGIFSSIPQRGDTIITDEFIHASIIDGVRLSHATRYVFKHNDIEDFEKQMVRATKLAETTGGAILVITEGVFGMRGDQGKLKEIIEMKKKFSFRLFVDDAHGIGTMGPNGGGTGEAQGCNDGIDIYFGTFAKSFALIGGFISSTKEIVTFLRYNMRSQIFAKSLPMPLVYGLLKRLELLNKHPEYRTKLWEIANSLQKGLVDAGFNIGDTNTMVTPVYMNGSIPEATNMVIDLRENFGIFCSMVVYPVIPKGMIILRLIPTATHTQEDVNYTIESFSKIKDKLYGGLYKADKIREGFSQAL
jgi:glycine C-acetyltransferase